MAVTVTMRNVTLEPGGRVLFEFSDGSGFEYASLADVRGELSQLDSAMGNAQRLLIAWWLARDDGASNPNLVEGKTLTFDLGAANPIRVQ